MIGMFWAEKYAMGTGLTLVVRALFKPKGTKDMWVSALTAGTAIISMNLGAGLLYPYSKEQYLFGIAEGIFVASSLVVLWTLGRKLFTKRPVVSENNFSPGEDRISHYTKAFSDLAKTFLSVPSGGTLAVVGMDDYEKVHAAWNARMDEQRVAVATQLTEISEIMEGAIRRAYDTKEDTSLERQLKRLLYKRGILLKKVYVYDNEEQRKEVYLTIRTRKKRCISNKDAAECLSEAMGSPMMPSHEA